MPFDISGGIESDEKVPELVSSPPDSDDEEYLVSSKKLKKIPGRFPWSSETVCSQTSFSEQATRWMKLPKEVQDSAYEAMKRLVLSPFLFQQLVIPEKWLRWAHKKSMITFDIENKMLPSGKLSRPHYLVVRMLDFSLRKLQTLTDKKKTVMGIMKMMYSIRNVPSTDADRAIKETRPNENVKILLDFIKIEGPNYPPSDRTFFDGMDRLIMMLLFCFRQFAEIVHIITCEGRDISSEVKSQFTDSHYNSSNDHNVDKEEGNKLYKSGKYKDAIDAYTKAINKAPFHYLLYSNRCQALVKLNDYESAFADAYRTVVLRPDFGKGYYKVVLCLSEMGWFKEALDWGNEGLSQCEDATVKTSLKDLIENINSKALLQNGKSVKNAVKEANLQAESGAAKKKSKTRKKKKKTKKEERELLEVPDLVSDDEFEECPAITDQLKKDEEEEKQREELIQKQEKEKKKLELVKKAAEINFEQAVQKGASAFLRQHYSDACKAYKSALDIVDVHKEIRGYTKNDVAILLYTRGVSSQRQGSPVEVDMSRQFFRQIIKEHRIFSHLCMVYYANAKSTYLLNDFDEAKKEVSTALQLVKSFPLHGVLTWSGSSENIPESVETVLRKEIKVLLQQCKVPPIPTAVCRYEECINDYSRKQIHLTDLGFEGYFEVCCDWNCALNFHLRCWSKFKHNLLNLLGDKEVLGMKCFTPDCEGKITMIRMLDERVLEKKIVEAPTNDRVKADKSMPSKNARRMSKSELNLMKYKEFLAEKKRKKKELKTSGEGESPASKKETRQRNQLSSDNIPADKDLSDATIYVKDNSQKAQGKTNRRIAPASLQHFCSSLPGYRKEMSIKEVDRLIERARSHGMIFIFHDEVREEIEQFVLSFGDEELIEFTEDQKIKMLFLFEYFFNFFSEKGPLDTQTLHFTNKFASLPDSMRAIVVRCGGLVSFLNASPLFIQIPPYIGTHSQHQHMKKLTEKRCLSANHNMSSKHSPVDLSGLDFEEPSDFAKEFYRIGADVEDSDLVNLIGNFNDMPSTNLSGDMCSSDQLIEMKRAKISQNSETSSMYSLEDSTDPRSEISSQPSCDAEKADTGYSTDRLNNQSQLKEISTTPTEVQPKKLAMPKKKLSTIGTQTGGQDELEKAKEVVARLQERVLELEDEFTKLKRTSQTREESLVKQVEQAADREGIAIKEKEKFKQATEFEVAKVAQYKKQVQAAEAKAEQCRLKEKEMEMNLLSLTEGMQRDRDAHLNEIMQLRKSVELKEKDIVARKSRAIKAEVELMRMKEAYHLGPHLQAKNRCEQGVREFDMELVRLSSFLSDHIMLHFKLARKQWADNVIACTTTIETLKAAYSSIIDQIKAGRPASELPAVPDLKPPAPAPNPRHMLMEMQRRGMINPKIGNQPMNGGGLVNSKLGNQPMNGGGLVNPKLGNQPMNGGGLVNPKLGNQPMNGGGSVNPKLGNQPTNGGGLVNSKFGHPPMNGGGDGAGTSATAPNVNGTQSPVTSQQPGSSPLPALFQNRVATPPAASATMQPPIGSELPKAPRKKNFLQLVEKLCKNLPQLTREQVEVCVQQVRADNKGLTGLLYEEIQQRIRIMAGLDTMHGQVAKSHAPTSRSPMVPTSWKSISAFHASAREAGDFWDHEEEAVCPICCDPLKDGKIATLDCQHKFHFDCINKWMQKQRTCPNCRKFMADTSEFPTLASQTPPGLMRNLN